MSATGLDVFDKTIQTTNIWLDELMADLGPDRQVAWHVLGAVLRALRDRVPLGLAAHLGSQLPILVRGTYYDQWEPAREPLTMRTQEEFLAYVQKSLRSIRPVNARNAVIAVCNVLSRHLTRGQARKVRDALPTEVQVLWHLDRAAEDSVEERAALGRTAQNAAEARAYRSRPEGQRPARSQTQSKQKAASQAPQRGSKTKSAAGKAQRRPRKKPAA
jgi:uncharacterized protein (DUF2267 family)